MKEKGKKQKKAKKANKDKTRTRGTESIVNEWELNYFVMGLS